MATTGHSSRQRCYLLELPGELRNEIYHHVFYQPSGLIIDLGGYKKKTSPVSLTILNTCKQIRKECGNLFFEMNELRLELPMLSEHELYGPTATESLRSKFNWLFNHRDLASRLQHVHLSLGTLTDRTEWHSIWSAISDVLLSLLEMQVRVRISFGLGFARTGILRDDVYVPYDFVVTDEERTYAAMEECLLAYGAIANMDLDWMDERIMWVQQVGIGRAIKAHQKQSSRL